MPVLCHPTNGFPISTTSSASYTKAMSASESSLPCKSNNNKRKEQNGYHMNGTGVGFYDTSRPRSASSALSGERLSNGTSHHVQNGQDSSCYDICMRLAAMVIYERVKSKDNAPGWLFRLRQNHNSFTEKDKYTDTLQRTVSEISERHGILFTSMVKKLNITRDNFEEVFISVVTDMFSDNEMNWGRVVTVYAFGAKMGEFLAENEMDDCLEPLAERVGTYVHDDLGSWIMDNGGWDAFVRFFPENLPDQGMWNGLMWMAGGLVGAAGLATILAMRT